MIIDKPPPEKVVWVYEETGGVGKSTLVKHLMLKYPHDCTYADGSEAKDIYFSIDTFFEDPDNDLYYFLIYLTRDEGNKIDPKILENLLDGMYFNKKYKSKPTLFNRPWVIVFANLPPNKTGLSDRKWQVLKIEDDGLKDVTNEPIKKTDHFLDG